MSNRKANAVARDLRTPKYRMRVEAGANQYDRDNIAVKNEIADRLEEVEDNQDDEEL